MVALDAISWLLAAAAGAAQPQEQVPLAATFSVVSVVSVVVKVVHPLPDLV